MSQTRTHQLEERKRDSEERDGELGNMASQMRTHQLQGRKREEQVDCEGHRMPIVMSEHEIM